MQNRYFPSGKYLFQSVKKVVRPLRKEVGNLWAGEGADPYKDT